MHTGAPDIQPLVIRDLQDRYELGKARYGTGLQPFNGRSGLRDLYEELMDAVMYVRQVIEEDKAMTSDDVDIDFRSDMGVDLIQHVASDASVVFAARVSTQPEVSKKALGINAGSELAAGSPEDKLICFLMKNKHGTPFEHNSMTFFIQAPIFVFRELMRHRIASYHEEFERYRELGPVFYLPAQDRRIRQVGKADQYRFESGTQEQWILTQNAGRRTARIAYGLYRQQLDAGVSREVARMVLPLSIYSSTYVTMNARAFMNFLSLRMRSDENSTVAPYPQREIEMVAEQMEAQWRALMPLTHAAFQQNGRVAP